MLLLPDFVVVASIGVLWCRNVARFIRWWYAGCSYGIISICFYAFAVTALLSSKVAPCFLFDHFKWRRKHHTCCNFPLCIDKQGLSCMFTACLVVHIVKHSVILVFSICWKSLFRILIASVMPLWTKCCLLFIGPRAPTNYGRRTTCSFHVIPDAGRENQ